MFLSSLNTNYLRPWLGGGYVRTVSGLHGHDIRLNSFKTSVAFKSL